MNKIEKIKKMWTDIYDPNKNIHTVMDEYFHSDYQQCINGVITSRAEYILHVMEQKKNMVVTNMDYREHIENVEGVFAIYYPKGLTNENKEVEAEVISYFQFQDDKLIRIHGQVRLIKGSYSDVDME